MSNEVDTKVIQALEAKPDGNLIRLSSGVVLRGKPAPPLGLVRVMAAFPRPNPPTWFNPTLGREVENPDDPDYVDRVRAHQNQSSNAMTNALILMGTELVEVPKKFPKPEDEAWVEEYRELGLTPKPNSASWRYLNWVQFKAVLNAEDMQKIMEVVGRLSGVPESAVQAAEDFPGSHKNSR